MRKRWPPEEDLADTLPLDFMADPRAVVAAIGIRKVAAMTKPPVGEPKPPPDYRKGADPMTLEEQREFARVDQRLALEEQVEMEREPAFEVEDESELGFDDTANAERLRRLHGDRIRYVLEWGTWLVWRDNHWVRDPRGVHVSELAKDVSRELYRQLAEEAASGAHVDDMRKLTKGAADSASRHRIDSMVSLARGIEGIVIGHEELDADPWALGVRNGWIDLHDGSFHSSDPSRLLTLEAGTYYEAGATAPLWEKALAQWLPDPEVRDYFQRLCGAALVGQIRNHLLVLIYGPGGNGKGTAIEMIVRVLGDYFVVPHKSLLVMQRHEQHATVKASLFRRRLAVAAEADQRIRLNEAQIKELTGGDRLSARRMYENEWSFAPTHTLWLQTNNLPSVAGTDRGIWRRIKVLPWTAQFTGEMEDRQLGEKLAGEAPGVLNWLLDGVAKWQDIDLGEETEPPSVRQATEDYRRGEDDIARWMADAGLILASDRQIKGKDLAKSFEEWHSENQTGTARFNEAAHALERMGCRKETRRPTGSDGKRTKVTTWIGIGFAN